MKKRKLKKKIKELRKELERVIHDATETFNNQSSKICTLGDKYSKLREDFDDFRRQINELKTKISCHDNRLSVLDARSRVDYTMYSKNKEEKTCDTCKWKPLMEQGGQDIPCMGCTADDKKMWKSKES